MTTLWSRSNINFSPTFIFSQILFGARGALVAQVIFVFFLLGAFPFFRQVDPDLFARVAVGELSQLTGRYALIDVFAFTPTNAVWYDHEWLVSQLFYLLSQWGEDPALLACKLLLFGLTVFFIVRTLQIQQLDTVSGYAWLFILAPELLNGFLPNIRCQMLTSLGLALHLFVFTTVRKCNSSRSLLVLPFYMLIWANSHAGFVIGIAFSFIFSAVLFFEQSLHWRMALVSAMACAAVTLINPYGWSYLPFIFDAVLHPRPLITEWGSLPLFSLRWWMLSLFVSIVAVGAALNPRILKTEVYIFLILLTVQAYSNNRLASLAMIGFGGLGAPSAIAGITFLKLSLRSHWEPLRDALATVFILSLVYSGGSVLYEFLIQKERPYYFSYEGYPLSATNWLRENRAGGNVLVHFDQASYVLWMLRYKFKVAIDGRYEELYPEETFLTALSAIDPNAPDHLVALQRVNPDFVIANTESNLKIDDFPGFKEVFKDSYWIVLEAPNRVEAINRLPRVQSNWKISPL